MKKQTIFYGPPGTGKTYTIQDSALQYLISDSVMKKKKQSFVIDYEKIKFAFNKFYNDHSFLLTDNKYAPGKKPYRNLRCINPIMTYLSQTNQDYVVKETLKNHFSWHGPSTYVQNIRVLTNFGLTENGMEDDSADQFKLSSKGLELKAEFSNLQVSGVDTAQTQHLADFVRDYFIQELTNTTLETMTLWKNMIFVGLRIVVENKKALKSTSIGLSDKEETIFNKCLGYTTSRDPDVLNWITAYLIELNLIDKENMHLTDDAISLLNNANILSGYFPLEGHDHKTHVEKITLSKKYRAKSSLIEERKIRTVLFDEFIGKKQIEIITFHPSFEYEDLIEGVTVKTENDGTLNYYYKTGILKNFCLIALKNCLKHNGFLDVDEKPTWSECYDIYLQNKNSITWDSADNFVFIIDELNRGDVAKVFGEVISLIEDDKRIGERNELVITLPYTQDQFGIPKNIFFLTTMNTSDKSIGTIDIAIRRRFDQIPLDPNFNIVKEFYDVTADEEPSNSLLFRSADALNVLNNSLIKVPYIGKGKLIGHALLMLHLEMNDEDIYHIWKYNIFPLLEEYFFNDLNVLRQIFNQPDDRLISQFEGFKVKTFEDIEELINTLVESYED